MFFVFGMAFAFSKTRRNKHEHKGMADMVTDTALKDKALDTATHDGFASSVLFSSDTDVLQQRLHERKLREMDGASLRRLAGAALDMLRDAHNGLETAHRQINTQRERIQHLESLATTDELTDLTNRRGFLEAFERELDRAHRGQNKGGLLLMIDLDNFKTINDEYSHAAGDAALKLVSETLKSTIRKMDVAGRLGGDEFVLLFSNADVMCALDRAQQLAIRLNSLTLRWRGERIPVRASIGMRAYGSGDTAASVLDAADENMYAVKASRSKTEKELLATA